jgi:hypothetical protein
MMQRFLRSLSVRLSRRAGFEVWAAADPGALLYAEATGLTRQEALSAAARCRRRRPGAAVLVLDATGAVIDRA